MHFSTKKYVPVKVGFSSALLASISSKKTSMKSLGTSSCNVSLCSWIVFCWRKQISWSQRTDSTKVVIVHWYLYQRCQCSNMCLLIATLYNLQVLILLLPLANYLYITNLVSCVCLHSFLIYDQVVSNWFDDCVQRNYTYTVIMLINFIQWVAFSQSAKFKQPIC
jgi:hypothetical protein